MQHPLEDFGPPPSPNAESGFSARHALLTFAFATFVLGGFSFGWLFVMNYKVMLALEPMRIGLGSGPGVALSRPGGAGIEPRGPGRGSVLVPTPASAAAKPVAPAVAPPVQQTDLPEWTQSDRVNVLLLGIDQRDDEPIDGTRSDTVMIASYDRKSNAVVMLSLPRDLWVSIPGYYPQRLNVAHSVGGPNLVKQTVQANFGINVNYYARVNFRGFEKVIDELGGVIIDVERPIKDDEYPSDDYGVMRLFIPSGPQLMDGKMALMYARSRHSENDFGRSRRQQRVLLAIRDRALAVNILTRLPVLARTAADAVSTDMGVTDMLALAGSGSKVERDQIKSVVVDVNCATPFVGPLGEDLLQPNRQCIQASIQRAFAEASGQTGKVEVLNGSPRDGVARRLADQLAGAGYDITKVDVAPRRDLTQTQIVALTSNQRAANAIAQRLGIPQSAILDERTPDATAEVRVIVGSDRP